jgi:HPr kinase/phosphorylase
MAHESTPEPGSYLYGSAVAVGEHALLIIGASGTGKTTLALEMIALGAALIADDRVSLQLDEANSGGAGTLRLSAPPSISGLVEVRGFGLLRFAARSRVALKLIADLDHAEPERLPRRRERVLSGIACPVMLCRGKPGLAAALTCLLKAEDWLGPEFLPI